MEASSLQHVLTGRLPDEIRNERKRRGKRVASAWDNTKGCLRGAVQPSPTYHAAACSPSSDPGKDRCGSAPVLPPHPWTLLTKTSWPSATSGPSEVLSWGAARTLGAILGLVGFLRGKGQRDDLPCGWRAGVPLVGRSKSRIPQTQSLRLAPGQTRTQLPSEGGLRR